MARETKIGLIVGLTFIICFAVILANRGRPRPANAHVTYAVDRGVSGTQIAQRVDTVPRRVFKPAGPAMPAPATSSAPTSTVPTATVSVEAPTSGTVASSSGASGEGSPGFQSVPVGKTAAPSSPRFPVSNRSKLLEDLASKLNERVVPGSATVVHTPSAPVANSLVNDNVARRSKPTPRPIAVTPKPIQRRPAPTSGETLRHTVIAGETLSKIAAHYYGLGSGKVVQALYAANRSVMKSPDLLRVGAKLQIPRLAGFAAPAAGGTGTRSAGRSPSGDAAKTQRRRAKTKTPPATKPSPLIRWYQVKKSDRYASIARRLLGDANRWREIFELNKDKFPDPNLIREGVRIKIPAAGAVVLGGARP